MLWRVRYPSAAAATIILAVMIVWLLVGSAANIAFADVIENLRNIRSFTVVLEREQDGDREGKAFAKGAKFRTEFPNGEVSIADWDVGKVLKLNPATKSAEIYYLHAGAGPFRPQANQLLGLVERMEKATTQKLGEKEIDGQRVTGFRAVLKSSFGGDDEVYTAWVDVETRLPFRLESIDPKTGRVAGVQHKFVWNPELHDSLFDLTPPPGYTIKEAPRNPGPDETEKDLVESLRGWATYNGQVFPDTYTPKAVEDVIRDAIARKQTQEYEAHMKHVIRGLNFAIRAEGAGEWHYAGKGVKLGEVGKPIAWWKTAWDAPTYRVLYGDLTIRDLKPEDLPKLPPG